MKEPYFVFYDPTGKELYSYTIRGTFKGELKDTRELLAYQNGLDVSEVSVKLEERSPYKKKKEKEVMSNFAIFETETREVVALVDTDNNKLVTKNGYDIIVSKDKPELKVKFFIPSVYPNGLVFVGNSKSDWIDLRTRVDIELKKGESAYIPLGVAIQLPKGYEAHLVPRSSAFNRWGVIQANSVGIIDESFCGDNDEWNFLVYATRDTVIKRGERVCQFRITKHQPEFDIEVVEHLNNPDRKGLGSTGTN